MSAHLELFSQASHIFQRNLSICSAYRIENRLKFWCLGWKKTLGVFRVINIMVCKMVCPSTSVIDTVLSRDHCLFSSEHKIPNFWWGERWRLLAYPKWEKESGKTLNQCFSVGEAYWHFRRDNFLWCEVVTNSAEIGHCWPQLTECRKSPLGHCDTQHCNPIFPGLPGDETE